MTGLSDVQQIELKKAFERDVWAHEWNSLPTAVDRIVSEAVEAARAETGVTSDLLRQEAQRRTESGYLHHATVRNDMRKLADHMDAMSEFGSSRAALSPDAAEGER